ncbi:hypothetical protein ACFSUD_17470 [Sulfitobacter aestuarii]|uniref:Uncharacterized protein n=1 Tax=Sulfitobacter aestuarii TaxID=2161676 RepID=A0ABW5U7R4_9RHOB
MALGGDLQVDAELSHKAVEEKIAKPFRRSVAEAALGIIRIISSNTSFNMARAVRSSPGKSSTLCSCSSATTALSASVLYLIGMKAMVLGAHLQAEIRSNFSDD